MIEQFKHKGLERFFTKGAKTGIQPYEGCQIVALKYFYAILEGEILWLMIREEKGGAH